MVSEVVSPGSASALKYAAIFKKIRYSKVLPGDIFYIWQPPDTIVENVHSAHWNEIIV